MGNGVVFDIKVGAGEIAASEDGIDLAARPKAGTSEAARAGV